MKKDKKITGCIFAILATAIWSGNYIVARGLVDEINPVSLSFLRWLVAVVFFTPFAIKRFIADLPAVRKNLIIILFFGFIGVSVYNTLIYIGGRTTTAINLSMIAITFPVFVIIISSLFLKEKIVMKQIIGVVLVIAGTVFLITNGDLTRLTALKFVNGDLWMVLASFLFAVYSVMLKRRPAELSIITFQYSTFLAGFIFLIPFTVMENILTSPMELSSTIIVSVLYVGIFASLVAFMLWNMAVDLTGSVRAGIFYYLLPAFSSVLAVFFLGEKIQFYHIISMGIIVLGIAVASIERKR